MIHDAHTHIAAGSQLTADICIIGSGAAALSMAHSLIQSGRKIVILEGSRANVLPCIFRGHGVRTNAGTSRLNENSLYEGSTSEFVSKLDPHYLTRSRHRRYGGSTNCWGGLTRPLNRIDFDRSDLSPRYVWPISRDDLDAFYNLAIPYCSLGTWDVSAYDDLTYWKNKTRRHMSPIDTTDGSLLHTGIVAIINHDAKGGGRLAFQIAWGPDLEEAPNVLICRNANARYLATSAGGGSVQEVLASTIDGGKPGHDFHVKATSYVIAAGGIETARLLLVSDGLGNHYDQVGRYFMLHPVSEVSDYANTRFTLSPSERTCYFGTTLNSGLWPPTLVAILMPTETALKRNGIGNCRLRLFPNNGMSFSWEQAPNPDSRITLDRRHDRMFGDPLVRVDWRPAALDAWTMMMGYKTILDELCECGYIYDYQREVKLTRLGDHHMGTTRMSLTPAHGVVDYNCRVHCVDNLYIAGSAVFATGGFAHPTLTIIALALILARHLVVDE